MSESLESLAAGINNTQEGIILTDMKGNIEFVNLVLEKLLIFSKAELDGQPISELIIGDEIDGSWSNILETIDNLGSYEFKNSRMMRRNGLSVLVKITAFPLKRPSDKESWLVFYILDISEEVKASQSLEKKNVELAKENSVLLKEKSNFQRISDMKTKFLGIASHELKTPLTSIKGYSEILLDSMAGRLDDKVYSMVERISRAADKLHNVVNDMLDVTRIEQNRLRLKPEDIDLHGIINEVIEDLAQFLEHRNIATALEISDDFPLFYGDKTRIHQVFTNLLSNAIKYSTDNTTITIIVRTEDENFRIIFKDQGVGISLSEKDNIFCPFYEVSNTVNHSSSGAKFMGGGTGLGLSIVKGIIERHGGIIWVESDGPSESDDQVGSEIHISLPIKPHINWSDDETQIVKLHTIMHQQIEDMGGGEESDTVPRILIIDDDAEAIEICRVLFNDKYEIFTSATGEVGLRIAFRDKPDLILLNFYLPGLSGVQICRILKSQEETKNIPVAFFSAATQDREIEQCYASGGDDYIVKPFTGKDLTKSVENLLLVGGTQF